MAPTQQRILVTGGCGYIGSHTLVSLLDSSNLANNVEYSVVVVDSLANSSAESLKRVAEISGLNFTLSEDGTKGQDDCGRLVFRKVNCVHDAEFRPVFEEFASSGGFTAAVHFAGLKAVGESKLIPLQYYGDNIGSTLTLLNLMEEFGCRSIVFSSSATVYGVAKDETAKLKETDEVGVTITNCYGRTKYMIEEILGDFHSSRAFLRADGKEVEDWSVAILRYFNPAGVSTVLNSVFRCIDDVIRLIGLTIQLFYRHTHLERWEKIPPEYQTTSCHSWLKLQWEGDLT